MKVRENKSAYYKTYASRTNPRETFFFFFLFFFFFFLLLSGAPEGKPCRAELGFGWVTHHEYRREGPYFVLSFSSFSFLRVVWCKD